MALRNFILLSRPWYLPTVWSNCLAGWWLGGGGNYWALPWLLGGASCLFLAGSFSKDALQEHFDRQNRAWRPVPAGNISRSAVYGWSLYWAAMGMGLLFAAGPAAGATGLVFLVFATAYNLSHRATVISPLVLGICRLVLYLLGAQMALDGVGGWAVWGGTAVALYTAGARWAVPEISATTDRRYWALVFILFPAFLGLVMNAGEHREAGLLLSLVVALWVVRSLRHTWFSLEPDRDASYSGLVAGTVFVDWLAAADTTKTVSGIFIGLFLASLLLQRAQPGIAGKAR